MPTGAVGTFAAMDDQASANPSPLPGWTESVIGNPSPTDPVRGFAVSDNLQALRAWGRDHAGRAALVLADPPYNARNRKDYLDDVDHRAWLEAIGERIELCLPLLRPDGILAMHIDDSEHAYLQVLLDGILGRERRLNTVVVKMSELAGVKMRYSDRMLPRLKEYVLLYGRGLASRLRPVVRRKDGPALERYLRYYAQFLENPNAPVHEWSVIPLREAMARSGIAPDRDAEREYRLAHPESMVYRTNNRWFDSLPAADRPSTRFARLRSPWGVEYVWWEGKQMLFLADHLDEPLGDLWTDISTINVQKEGAVPLRSSKKPEALVRRLLDLCSQPGDLVIDPWAGSGTTAAVAHKTGRGWLSCERDPAIAARALDRLASVVAGTDPTGETLATGWTGGGGFHVWHPCVHQGTSLPPPRLTTA